MSLDAATLYALLPSILRARDIAAAQASGGDTGPLEQLVALLAEPIAALEENLTQLYDDQFIETCAPWVVPYIGDLVGYAAIRGAGGTTIPRADVANTIRWRRAKGTLRALEGVVRDVAGRDAVVVEARRALSVTANLNHVATGTGPGTGIGTGTASLADPTAFVDPGGPFDAAPHGTDIRTVACGGRWGIPDVVAFLWPWRAWPRWQADAVPVDGTRFVFHPFGTDAPLLNQPIAVPAPPSARADLPVRLRLRDGLAAGGAVLASVTVWADGAIVPAAALALCDLSDAGPDPDTAPWANMPQGGAGQPGVALDPERGRLAFAVAPTAVQVGFFMASSGLLGGGAYPRGAGFDATLAPVRTLGVGDTLAAVLAAPGFTGAGAIEIGGNARLAAAGLPATITVAAGAKLEIRAADGDWPTLLLGQTLMLEGGAGAQLVLDGFTIEGADLQIPALAGTAANGLQSVTLRHCTLVPGWGRTRAGAPVIPGAASLTCDAPDTVVVLANCVTGPVRGVADGQFRISNCVVDAGDAAATALGGPVDPAPCGSLWIYNSTVRGTVRASLLALASNTAFLSEVGAAQLQSGLARFSAFAAGYAGPRTYSCVTRAACPVIRSWQPGDPFYARLSASSPVAVLTGADDGGEIGAFHDAYLTQAADGVGVRLAEYTPFGLDAGLRQADRA